MLENQHIITQEVAMRNADSIDRLAVNVGELSKAIAAIAESNNKVVAAFSPQYLNWKLQIILQKTEIRYLTRKKLHLVIWILNK